MAYCSYLPFSVAGYKFFSEDLPVRIQWITNYIIHLGCPDNGGAQIKVVQIREVPLFIPTMILVV